jgi:hypothetical protein
MAGIKGKSGRPGGNPDLKEHQFSTDRPEALTKQMQLRVSESMWAELQALEGDWREFVRTAIATALASQD